KALPQKRLPTTPRRPSPDVPCAGPRGKTSTPRRPQARQKKRSSRSPLPISLRCANLCAARHTSVGSTRAAVARALIHSQSEAYARRRQCGIGPPMTERLRIEHEFECSEKGFWETFLNREYNHEMFRQHMKFPRWELSTFDMRDEEVVRVVEVEPYVGPLPGPVKKVL